jgi:ADP-ribose pyrophosphatase YjhB (NUDIX family)
MHIPSEIYDCIVKSMPVACVDLLVKDMAGQVLLLKRNNPPMRGHWWLPGGRVYFGEYRETAARRKLSEECGLVAVSLREIGTFDLILDEGTVHSITTVFEAVVDAVDVSLDSQSSHFAWRPVQDWLTESLHPFVIRSLTPPVLAPEQIT